MGLSRGRVIKLGVMAVFLCCMFFANFVAVRMILRYGVETYFYDKLLVAYTIGGAKGLKTELNNMIVGDSPGREAILAKDFTARLEALGDIKAFLQDKVYKGKKIVASVRNLRLAAIYLMFILFAWQLIIKSCPNFRFKKSS